MEHARRGQTPMWRELHSSQESRTKGPSKRPIKNPHVKTTDNLRSKVPARASALGAAFSGPTAALVHFTCTSHAPVNTWGWGWGWGGALMGRLGRCVWPVVLSLSAAGRLQRCPRVSLQATRTEGSCILKNVAPFLDGTKAAAYDDPGPGAGPWLALQVLGPRSCRGPRSQAMS